MPVRRSVFRKNDAHNDGVLSAEESVLHELFPKGQRVQVTAKAKKRFSHSKFKPGDTGIVLECPEDEWARNCLVLFDDGDSQKVALKYIAPIFMNDDGEEVEYGALHAHERESVTGGEGKRFQGTVATAEQAAVGIGTVAGEVRHCNGFGASQEDTIAEEVVVDDDVEEVVVEESKLVFGASQTDVNKETIAQEVVAEEVVEKAAVEESELVFGVSQTEVNVDEPVAVARKLVSGTSEQGVDLQYATPQQIATCEYSVYGGSGQDGTVEEVVAEHRNWVFDVGSSQVEEIVEEVAGPRDLMSDASQDDENLQYSASQQISLGSVQPGMTYECDVGDVQLDEGMQHSINVAGEGVVVEADVVVGGVVAEQRNLVFGTSQQGAGLQFCELEQGISSEYGVVEEIVEEVVAGDRNLVVFDTLQDVVTEEVAAASRNLVLCTLQGGTVEEVVAENRNWGFSAPHSGVVKEVVAGNTNLMAGTPQEAEVVEEVVAVDTNLVDGAPLKTEIVGEVVAGETNLVTDILQKQESVEQVVARQRDLVFGAPLQQEGGISEYGAPVGGVQFLEGMECSADAVGQAVVAEEVVVVDMKPDIVEEVAGREIEYVETRSPDFSKSEQDANLQVGASQQAATFVQPETTHEFRCGGVQIVEGMQYSGNGGAVREVVEDLICGAPQNQGTVRTGVNVETGVNVKRNLGFGAPQQGVELQGTVPQQTMTYEYGVDGVQQGGRQDIQYSGTATGKGGVATVQPSHGVQYNGVQTNMARMGMAVPHNPSLPVTETVAVADALCVGVPQQTLFTRDAPSFSRPTAEAVPVTETGGNTAPLPWHPMPQQTRVNGNTVPFPFAMVTSEAPSYVMPTAESVTAAPSLSSTATHRPLYSMPTAQAITATEVGGTAPFTSTTVTYEAPLFSMPPADAVKVTEVEVNAAHFPPYSRPQQTLLSCEAPSCSMPPAETVLVKEIGGNTPPSLSYYMPITETSAGAMPLVSYSMPIAGAVAVAEPLVSYATPITGVAVTGAGAVAKTETISEDCMRNRELPELTTRGWVASEDSIAVKFRAVCAAPAVRATKVTSPCETVLVAVATLTPLTKAGIKGQASRALAVRARGGRSCCG